MQVCKKREVPGQYKFVLFDLISFFGVVVPADILHQKMTETCASAHIGGVNIVLLEGITPDIQYVQTLLLFSLSIKYFSSYLKRNKAF